MTEKSYRLQLVVIHPLISVAIPSIFALVLHALCRGSLGLPPGFPDGLVVLFPLVSVVEAVAGNASRLNRSPGYARVREVALCLLGAVVLLVLLRVPFQHMAYLCVMMLITWGISFLIHGWLRSREELLRATEGKTGRDLDRALHQAMLLEGDTLTLLTRVRRTATALCGVNVTLAAVLILVGLRVTVLSAALLILQALVRLGLVATLNAMSTDQRLLGQGLRLDRSQRARRMTQGTLELAGATLLSLLASRASPLVPLAEVVRLLDRLAQAIRARRPFLGPWLRDLLSRFWNWLLGLFPRLSLTAPQGRQPSLPAVGEPSEIARRVFFALGMTALVVVIGLVAAFLTAPLGEKDFLEGLERKRPLRFLVRRLRLLARLVRGLFAALRDSLAELARETRGTAATRSGPDETDGRAGEGESGHRGRRRERRQRSLRQRTRRAWLHLRVWAEELGLDARLCVGPLELATRAAGVVREREAELRSAAELVERVLYAGTPAGGEAIAELERLVRRIVRTRRVAGGRT